MTDIPWSELLIKQRTTVRLIYDENLPPSLRHHLYDLFPGSTHVRDVELTSSSDSAIWDYSKAFNFAILTKDGDFAERVRMEGPPPSVIQIRAGNCSVGRLVTIIREHAQEINTHVQFGGALLEIGERASAATENAGPSSPN